MKKILENIQQTRDRFLVILTLAFFVAGCAPVSTDVQDSLSPLTQPLVWPDPPETPRILYVASIYEPGSMQIDPGFWERLWNYLAGIPQYRLVAPFGVAADSSGSLYVVDSFLRKTMHFDPVRGKTHLFPEDDTSMQSPIDITIDEKRNRLYVSDSTKGVIRIFAVNGSGPPRPTGELGGRILGRPTGIAINNLTSELLIVDTGQNTIHRFDLTSQKLLGSIGRSGTGHGEFNRPTGICVDRDGRIIVSDALNCRVQIFSPHGVYLNSFGSAGDGPGYFARPRGVATDSDKNIYVVDALFDNVQIFDQDGRLLMAFGGSGDNAGQFWLPAGICIAPDDRIFIADSFNKRVQVFQYLQEGRLSP